MPWRRWQSACGFSPAAAPSRVSGSMALGAWTLAASFALSLALGLYLTPLLRRGALRFGVLDAPDGRFKRHRAPTPYLGGVAVYLAFVVTLSLVFEFRSQL